MSSLPVHCCECARCRAHKPHPDRAYHHQINLFLSRLNEPQRRWFAALEAMRIGHGGKQLLAAITGLAPMTIRRGCLRIVRHAVTLIDYARFIPARPVAAKRAVRLRCIRSWLAFELALSLQAERHQAITLPGAARRIRQGHFQAAR